MQHPDEGTIHAWLDGQLSADEGAELEAHAATCAECAASIAEARGLAAASSRIVSSLDIVPGGVIPVRAPVKRAWYLTTQFRAAAAVLFVAGVSLVLTRWDAVPEIEEVSRQTPTLSLESAAVSEPVEDAQTSAVEQAAAPIQDGAANLAAKSPAPPAAPAPQPAAPESEWTGRGVTAIPERDAAARTTAVGAAAGSREMLQQSAPPVLVMAEELQVVRVDSTAAARTTVYLVPPGVEISLTETTEIRATFATGRVQERQATGAQAMSKAAAPPPAAERAPQAVTRSESADTVPAASISWTDSTTNKVFLLTGPVGRERLEEIRKLIEQKRRP
ncbi:MAG: anti-sigma factor family protein [Gemmatimonadaceae bacterium]